jgi:CCR4-NOT complex subunit CAF16
MADQDTTNSEIALSIAVTNLSYAFPDGSSGLKEVFLNLPPGSRTLLIGGESSMTSIGGAFSIA